MFRSRAGREISIRLWDWFECLFATEGRIVLFNFKDGEPGSDHVKVGPDWFKQSIQGRFDVVPDWFKQSVQSRFDFVDGCHCCTIRKEFWSVKHAETTDADMKFEAESSAGLPLASKVSEVPEGVQRLLSAAKVL